MESGVGTGMGVLAALIIICIVGGIANMARSKLNASGKCRRMSALRISETFYCAQVDVFARHDSRSQSARSLRLRSLSALSRDRQYPTECWLPSPYFRKVATSYSNSPTKVTQSISTETSKPEECNRWVFSIS